MAKRRNQITQALRGEGAQTLPFRTPKGVTGPKVKREARRKEITGAMTGGTEAPPRRQEIQDVVRRERSKSVGPSVSPNAQAGLGAQLSNRVKSGAITQKQAQRTAGERSQFQRAYGPDWRKRVFGNEAGNLASLRKAATGGDLGSKNELGQLMEKRARLLAKAKKRNPGVGPGQAA